MRKKHLLAVFSAMTFSLSIEAQNIATFTEFTYQGTDKLESYDPATQYLNPILSGCYPDPSITRKGDDYYLANSSFSYFPGVPIWHSRDLVNWDFVGYALDRPSQLNLGDGVGLSEGVYAPDIKYNPYNDTFYLIVTAIGSGGNIVVKTKDPAKGWSDPIRVDVPGIDPAFLFEPDGKAYIVNNQDPETPAEYDGHRAIGLREYDLKTDRIVGPCTQLVNKGVHPEDKPIWIEGPHLYHIGGSYYLMCAEGGTGDDHSEVVFKSDNVRGPYTPCSVNPILTQRTLPKNRPNPITAAGHADLFQTPTGEWWAVFLSILPYQYDDKNVLCNTGRNTLLLPARWENGQPIILDNGETVPYVVDKKDIAADGERKNNTGNVTIRDEFKAETLDPMWMQLRTPRTKWYALTDNGLELQARDISIYEEKNPSFLCRWIKNFNFTSTVTMVYTPKAKGDFAGFACYQKENYNYVIGKTLDKKGKVVIVLNKRAGDVVEEIASVAVGSKKAKTPVHFKIEAKAKDYAFFYSFDGSKWEQLGDVQDGSILSTQVAGGFTGAVLGMYATSSKDAVSKRK